MPYTKTLKDYIVSLPEFDEAIFESTTGLKITNEQIFSGKKVEIKIGDKTYQATIE